MYHLIMRIILGIVYYINSDHICIMCLYIFEFKEESFLRAADGTCVEEPGSGIMCIVPWNVF